jgi:hypothetical protein
MDLKSVNEIKQKTPNFLEKYHVKSICKLTIIRHVYNKDQKAKILWLEHISWSSKRAQKSSSGFEV